MHHIQYSGTVFIATCQLIWNAMGYWRWNLPFYYGYLIFWWLHLKNVEPYCVSLPRRSRHPLLRSQLKEKTHQRLLSFSLISNKGGPTGKGTQTGGNPCPPVHLDWGGGRGEGVGGAFSSSLTYSHWLIAQPHATHALTVIWVLRWCPNQPLSRLGPQGLHVLLW